MSLRDPAPAPRPTVPLASLRDGDSVVPDRGYPDLQAGYPHTVRVDEVGPWVGYTPRDGRRYLARHCDTNGNVVGMGRYQR